MKLRAVICDDEDHIRTVVSLMLKGMGVEVVAQGRNAQQAVDLYRREKPDLLLLDINLPGKSGEEALAEIIAEFPSAFVIMLTSVADAATVRRCLDKGASNYILKETPAYEMMQIIKESWQEHRMAAEGSEDA